MLTVYALKDAKDAADYYERDNYYLKGTVEGIAATHWWGKGAELLGLLDYVDPEKFLELLQGKIDKNTTVERTRHDGGINHKPGYDLTYSAPKSVSILAEIGKDDRIYEAHNNAVNKSLEYIQKNAALYRQTVDSDTQIKQGDNLIVAKFRHDTSRSVDDTIDCQLHTHCIVMNAVQGEDGQWRSLQETAIFDLKMVGGMVYRAALAEELQKIGYEIEVGHEKGFFEVVGITRNHIEEFSKRRIQIEEVMAELGLSGSRAAQIVTLNTRNGKVPIDRNKLQAHWQERSDAIDMKPEKVVEASKKREKLGLGIPDSDKKKRVADKAVRYALSHLTERQSVFPAKDLHITALKYGLGTSCVEDIEEAMERLKEAKELVYVGKHKLVDVYTSQKVLAQERRIVEIMQNGKNEFDAITSKEAVDLYLKERIGSESNFKLTNCQEKAVKFLSTSTDRVSGIQGYAGTGKTTMLNAVCRIAEQAGYCIQGATPGGSAAGVLRRDTGIQAMTLSRLLIKLQKEEKQLKSTTRGASPNKPTEKRLIILDEASMASTSQVHDLLEFSEKLNIQIFLVGDAKQLASVENGAPFRMLQECGLAFVELIQVVRQKAHDLIYAVKTTIEGEVDHAFSAIGNKSFTKYAPDGEALFSPKSTIEVIEDKKGRLTRIAKLYLALDQEGRDNTIVLLGANADRQEVNKMIRDGLKKQGIISGPETACTILQSKNMTAIERTHIYNYAENDIVRFNKNYRSLGIKRYDYCRVAGIDCKTQELILIKDNGKQIRWKPEGSAKTKGGAVEVFTKEEVQLSAGDYIRWTKNRSNYDIYNTETAQVVSVSGHMAKIRLSDDKIIDFDLRESINSHWDYAWSSTTFAAQGKKAWNVIAMLESFNHHLTTYSSFYVILTRAVNSIHLITDHLEKTIETVKRHTGEKSNAVEYLEVHQEKLKFEKYIKNAGIKLDGRIHEDHNEFTRLVKLAKHYASFDDKEKVYLIATDFRDRTRLNALIREERRAKNQIGSEEFIVGSLRKFRTRSNDSKMQLIPGMVIGFDKGYKRYGVKKGDYFTVSVLLDSEKVNTGKVNNGESEKAKKAEKLNSEKSDSEKNGNPEKKVLIKHVVTGQEIVIDVPFLVSRQDKEVSLCKLDRLGLSASDQIIWTRSFKNDGLVKGEEACVKEISKESMTLELQNKEVVTFNTNDPRVMYWRYAYAKSLSDPTLKDYQVGLSHVDERIRSPARLAAIFGAMGKAKESAHIHSHSKDYVAHHLMIASGEKEIYLKPYAEVDIRKDIYNRLQEFETSKKEVGMAWASYFDSKKLKTNQNEKNEKLENKKDEKIVDSETRPNSIDEITKRIDENLRNALILDRTHAELADHIVSDSDFNKTEAIALGIDTEKLQKYAEKHKVVQFVDQYKEAMPILRGRFASEIAGSMAQFAQELQFRDIDQKLVFKEAYEHRKRMAHFKRSPEERRDFRMVEAYFEYQKQAFKAWKRISVSKDKGMKPEQGQYSFGKHLNTLRNTLAKEITTHPGRFDKLTKDFSVKAKNNIQKHSKSYDEVLERVVKYDRALNTKDWRQVVDYEQSVLEKSRHIEYSYPKKNKKIYWDTSVVMPILNNHAQEIISGLVSEDFNPKKSNKSKLVWGKKNGSVHFSLSGPKAGLASDFERGIFGEIVSFYAKKRGITWYDGVCELAARFQIHPDHASVKFIDKGLNKVETEVEKNAREKKEREQREEDKKRERVKRLAQKTWDESQPIKGTLVERYLKHHRGMKFDVTQLEIRYHPNAPDSYGDKNGEVKLFGSRGPAMVVSFRNAEGELTAVQCTYLDKETANKDKNAKVSKRTIGHHWGSAGIIYRGGNDKVIIGEGCETAASLVTAVPTSSIYITGGNMGNAGHYDFLAKTHGKDEIHIVADNDLSLEAGSWKMTEVAAQKIAMNGIKPLISRPESIRGEKTDFNDVLKRYGEREVSKQFYTAYTMDLGEPITEATRLVPVLKENEQEKNLGLEKREGGLLKATEKESDRSYEVFDKPGEAILQKSQKKIEERGIGDL